MKFAQLASYFEKLEHTASRNEMTVLLSDLFTKTPPDIIGKICYLLQGRVVPLYTSLEFGMADKMVIRAIAQALGTDVTRVTDVFKKKGDLGETAESLKKAGVGHDLNIRDVFATLYALAKSSGAGSQEQKITQLSDLVQKVDPLSARYIVRIVLAKLRLGFSDMTILDSLSWMLTGSKKAKPILEAAYNVRPDLAFIAERVKQKGVSGLNQVKPTAGTPIMMARANRLTSSAEIIKKIGECAVEFKYDGLRLQVHKKGRDIKMFSRNLEDITPMFPDIAEAVASQITANEVIFEGEIVAYNPQTGVHVAFQETMQRKRKYDIAEKALEIPVKLYAFELLYADGKSYLDAVYKERKAKLKSVIAPGKTIIYAQELIAKSEQQIEQMFDESVKLNFEGIIAKKLDGLYEAGVRGWNWIKFKRAMSKKLADTLDVLVMGYTKGEGKRTDFGVGQFLTGVYDAKQDKFLTVSKIGTGLTDEQFREFFTRVGKLKVSNKPALYEVEKLLVPDVWLKPGLVVEVSCDEITRSAVHTAGRVMEPSKSGKALSVKLPGFALRFPRLERFRDDKRPTDATTVREVEHMYKLQGGNK